MANVLFYFNIFIQIVLNIATFFQDTRMWKYIYLLFDAIFIWHLLGKDGESYRGTVL